MKNYFLLLIVFFTLAACSQTDLEKSPTPLSIIPPEKPGLSQERLSRIDSMFKDAISKDKIPGAVALVSRNGKIFYHKAFGMADNESGRIMKPDDIFRIASQTKAITATGVMILWEEGRFRLDDPISKYIPEFEDPQVLKTFDYKDTSYTTVPAASEITIRQLLTHTSGIGYGIIDGDERFRMMYAKAGITDAWTTGNVTIAENIKKLARLPLHHNPGEQFTYSEGLDVLGYFIEIMSGMPFDEFLRTRLFVPLGMNDTWFYLPEEKAQRLVSLQYYADGKWTRYPVTFYDPDFPVTGSKRFFAGGAGLSSTAKDYAAFLQMYLNGGELNGRRILARTTIQAIMGNQNYNIWGEEAEDYYGLAFSVLTKRGQDKGGRGSTGTFTWGGYFNTIYFADPRENTIGILMKQTQDAVYDDTEWKFRILVGQAIE
jgi:CubicO group peptidase (beta-lactamase class C family)